MSRGPVISPIPSAVSHDHSHDHARQGRSLLLAIALNLGFAVAELIFGLIANSLVLVADAVHDAGDAVALGLSWFGLRMSRRRPNARRTFGYRKVRILTAFINALFLFGVTAFIVRAAIARMMNPEPVQSTVLIVMAVVGLFVNGAAVLLLRRDRRSLNIRAALWHMLEDFLGWVAVLTGGIVIRLTGWYIIDQILSLVVSAFVLRGAWSVFREATSILIDSTPKDLDFAAVRERILSFDPDITGIHDLHIWTLGEEERALSAHLVVPDRPLSSFYPMLCRLEAELAARFRIDHVTLELECDKCKSNGKVCLD
ncbi:MAG TPA: cation transporter [candidate division WOR-3 bacterium]|uniref:Cation transporter n=1 Tax=candidate division WOR-3 bacterium TaxID=2052148 RepID=A0A7V0XFB2_UNCW3|nr:cation transporter [candidate division WOR-3 bacterium]